MHSRQLYHTFKKIPTKILIFCVNEKSLAAFFRVLRSFSKKIGGAILNAAFVKSLVVLEFPLDLFGFMV